MGPWERFVTLPRPHMTTFVAIPALIEWTHRVDPKPTGGFLDGDGSDGRGAQSASGVYFYEARMDNEVEVGKLALIR